MHDFVKRLDKRWGGHKVFWGSVVLFIILLLILGFSLVRRSGEYKKITFSRAISGKMMPQGIPLPPPIRPSDADYFAANVRLGGNENTVRSGSLSLLSRSAQEGTDSVSAVAGRYGGFVERLYVYDLSDDTRAAEITVRVPDGYFEQAFRDIKNTAVKVVLESISAENKGERLADLEAHLASLKSEEKQYKELLSKATKTDDILKIRSVLSQVEGTIAALKSDLSRISRESEMSWISVSLTSEKAVKVLDTAWKPGTTIDEGLKNLTTELLAFVRVIILFLLALPVFIFKLSIFALVLIGVWRVILWVEKEFKK